MSEGKSIFEVLNSIDVSGKVKEKNKLSYLPWASAWAEVKKVYPEASFEIKKQQMENGIERPWLDDGKSGWVEVSVTINPNGFYSIAGPPDENPYCIQSVYIMAKDYILYERLGKRGDTAREAARRIISDREDFESIGDCVDFWIANDGTFSIEEIAAAINRRVENKKDK